MFQSLPLTTQASIVFALVGAILFALGLRSYALARMKREEAEELAHSWADDRTDVWMLQQDLMERSGQRLPSSPLFHKGVLLYGLLNLEELGETFEALASALWEIDPRAMRTYFALGSTMRHWSKVYRAKLASMVDFEAVLHPRDAKAIFDGTTDLMVTNAGFALSAGMPGAQGYAEVQDSNLSKQNPQTGRIDKTADGKWIKGPNYREPDLLGVLREHSPTWALRVGLTSSSGGADSE